MQNKADKPISIKDAWSNSQTGETVDLADLDSATEIMLSLWDGNYQHYNPTQVYMALFGVGMTISIEHGDNFATFTRVETNKVTIFSNTILYGYIHAIK